MISDVVCQLSDMQQLPQPAPAPVYETAENEYSQGGQQNRKQNHSCRKISEGRTYPAEGTENREEEWYRVSVFIRLASLAKQGARGFFFCISYDYDQMIAM